MSGAAAMERAKRRREEANAEQARVVSYLKIYGLDVVKARLKVSILMTTGTATGRSQTTRNKIVCASVTCTPHVTVPTVMCAFAITQTISSD